MFVFFWLMSFLDESDISFGSSQRIESWASARWGVFSASSFRFLFVYLLLLKCENPDWTSGYHRLWLGCVKPLWRTHALCCCDCICHVIHCEVWKLFLEHSLCIVSHGAFWNNLKAFCYFGRQIFCTAMLYVHIWRPSIQLESSTVWSLLSIHATHCWNWSTMRIWCSCPFRFGIYFWDLSLTGCDLFLSFWFWS